MNFNATGALALPLGLASLQRPASLSLSARVSGVSRETTGDESGSVRLGTQTFFVGIQEVSVFRGIQKVSARRLRKELINHNLYLFA